MINSVIKVSPMSDWTPKIHILDVRSYKPMTEPCVYVFGGLLGELIMTFSSINDYVLANPNIRDGLGPQEMENFLTALFAPGAEFPKDSICLELTNDLSMV